jgi:hypothetical protein
VSEDAQERHHRQLDELLTEIRVVLPGVQVLFAFLLSLPFLASFHSVTAAQRIIYFISFLATTVAMALLIVPPAFHRMRFEQHQKANIIHTGTRFALLALALLAVAVVGVVYVVTDVLYHWPAAVVVGVVFGGLFGALWYWLPTRQAAAAPDRSVENGPPADAGGGRDPLAPSSPSASPGAGAAAEGAAADERARRRRAA